MNSLVCQRRERLTWFDCNACRSLRDRLCFGFVICISASSDLTSLVLLYSSRRRNKNSELSYETELSCLSKSSISLAIEKKNSAIFGNQETTTFDRKPRLGEVKTSIDITTGQRSLFLDWSVFFFQSTRIFFSTQISKF